MYENIKILDNLPINDILQELSSCPDGAWHELDEWVNPRADKIHKLYELGLIKSEEEFQRRLHRSTYYIDESREQERLHLLWQTQPSVPGWPWWVDSNWRSTEPTLNLNFGKYFVNTIKQMSEYWKLKNKSMTRAFFSRLQPGKQIYPHQDGKWGHNYSNHERYGLVIKTNYTCSLTVNGDTVNPEAGTLFWANTRLTHSAINPAGEARILLYMDVDQGK